MQVHVRSRLKMKKRREQTEEKNEMEERKAENGEEKWIAASKWKREEEDREKNGLRNGKEENSKEEWIAASKLKREEEEQKLNKVGKRRGEDEVFRGETEEEEKIAASKFTCFEDVLEVVGSRGRWNVGLLFLCASRECLDVRWRTLPLTVFLHRVNFPTVLE